MKIRIRTPARLHFTLIDMNGEIGRLDGSLGLTISDPGSEFELCHSSEPEITGAQAGITPRLERELRECAAALNVSPSVEVKVVRLIPEHQGLGSATQHHLALLSGLARLYGRSLSWPEIIKLSRRGGTSGIGTYAFLQGGLLVDGGHRRLTVKSDFLPSHFCPTIDAPPLILRQDFPSTWRVILFIPHSLQGLEGASEKRFMEKNTPLPRSEVASVCHLILMRLLPALCEQDIKTFGEAVDELQTVGWKRRHWEREDIKSLRQVKGLFSQAGFYGCGLSSTGATLFGFAPDLEQAEKGRLRLKELFLETQARDHPVPEGRLLITEANNTGTAFETSPL